MRCVLLTGSLLLLPTLISSHAVLTGKGNDAAVAIRKLEQRLNSAVVTGNVDFFKTVLADDFTHGSQSGRFRTKAQWLRGRKPGKSSYISFDVENLNIRIAGDTALVTGLSKPKWRNANGTIGTGQFRFLRVWVNRGGTWRVSAFQATQVPEKKAVAVSDRIPKEPTPTKEFEIKNDHPFLGGKQIDLWGLRCGNALMSQAVTERHIRNFDNWNAHGINFIGVYIQGSNGGWPDPAAGKNGYTADGKLKPDFAGRLEWLIREADRRGMVVMVGLFSPRKDQELNGESAVQTAIEETAQFLTKRKLKNVFVDIMHEYNHPTRIELPIFREPNSAQKKARMTAWFKKYAPGVEVGICPYYSSKAKKSTSTLTYPGMDVLIIQKEEKIPKKGLVVNVETQRHDAYSNDGKYEADEFPIMFGYFKQYKAAPNAFMLFHSGFCQGITNKSGSAPHAEMGGYGKSENDRGIRFYYEWVRDNIGRYEYPRHVRVES